MAFKSCTSTPDMFDGFLAAPPKNEILKRLRTLINWRALRQTVAPAYAEMGRCGFDPVLLIKMLLLERLYQLSDGDVVVESADRLSFREFLELKAADPVPDDTTLVKFRGRLRNRGNLLDRIMEEIERQLSAQGVAIKEGHIKIVDASLIEAAVAPPIKPKEGEEPAKPLDPDADWGGKKGKQVYGYKLHLGQDRETGLVAGHVVTPASVHDSRVFEQFLDQGEKEVLADKGYDSREHRKMLAALGAKASIMKRAEKNKSLNRWWKGRNKSIGRVRSFVEGTFAQLKRYLGCARARYRGLVRVREQMTWGVMAFNLRRAVALLWGEPKRPKRREKCAQTAG